MTKCGLTWINNLVSYNVFVIITLTQLEYWTNSWMESEKSSSYIAAYFQLKLLVQISYQLSKWCMSCINGNSNLLKKFYIIFVFQTETIKCHSQIHVIICKLCYKFRLLNLGILLYFDVVLLWVFCNWASNRPSFDVSISTSANLGSGILGFEERLENLLFFGMLSADVISIYVLKNVTIIKFIPKECQIPRNDGTNGL